MLRWFRFNNSTRVTATQLAFKLTKSAAEQAELLQEHLREFAVPARRGGRNYDTELILYCLFPFDMLVAEEIQEGREAVRSAMRVFLSSTLRDSLGRQVSKDPTAQHMDDVISHRFSEYSAAALSNTDPELQLGMLAYERISGGVDVDAAAAMVLGLSYARCIQHMRKPIGSYSIVPPTTEEQLNLEDILAEYRTRERTPQIH